MDDEARRWLSYLQEQGLVREVGKPCLEMLLNRCPHFLLFPHNAFGRVPSH